MLQGSAHPFLPRLGDRADYFRYFNGRTASGVSESTPRLPTRSTISAYVLETGSSSLTDSDLMGNGDAMQRIDSDLYRLHTAEEEYPWALMEIDNPRFPTIYTALPTQQVEKRVRDLQQRTPGLDRIWLSSTFFWDIWDHIEQTTPDHRFSQITFEHESIFAGNDAGHILPTDSEGEDDELDRTPIERRKANLKVNERVRDLTRSVVPWRTNYSALSSVVQMRIPAIGRGGYDVFHNGRFANRSDSTTAFREIVRDVIGLYASTTRAIEDTMRVEASQLKGGAVRFTGAPLFMTFSTPLDITEFDRWVASFRRRNNRFRLWGNPVSRGTGKAHIYAVDNHLWQTVDLELSTHHLYAILPRQTCGNTVHRLVTSVQRFIDPAVDVFVGDRAYRDLVREARDASGE